MTSDLTTFMTGALALLAAPGPTNTLIATSAAAVGWVRSLPLLAAELAGYAIAIAVLICAVGDVVAKSPAFGAALSALVCTYLLYLAAKLWRQGGVELSAGVPASVTDVLLTTVVNPKGIVLAFSLLPSPFPVETEAVLTWGGALALAIAASGALWLAIGAALKRSLPGSLGSCLVCRGGAVALTLLAGGIGGRLVTMI